MHGAAALLAVLALGSACRYFRAPPLAESTEEAHVAEAAALRPVLAPGDRVSVVVFQHPETSTPAEGLPLDPEGRLDLPLVGPVLLAGLSLDEARARLGQEFGRYLRDPRVSLNLLEPRGRRIYVFGEVERPGAYPLDRPLNALQALSLAGGFRPGADRDQVALLRGQADALQVYFFDGATPGPDGLVSMHPDDFLFVRLSGAGTFRDQILPIVQTIVPPITALASLLILADQLDE
jgi:protein involved in polysaccharide export with SLBB domain